MTRRGFLASAAAAAALPAATAKYRLAVESYIFQQYAERLNRPLQASVQRAASISRAAGFREIELSAAFLPPAWRQSTLSAVKDEGLTVPSVYVAGGLYQKDVADKSIADALEYGALCQRMGCVAVVQNPEAKPNDQRKTDDELAFEADALNRMGRALAERGLHLRVHHHTTALEENGREWQFLLEHTDASLVFFCVDVDWVYEAGMDPMTVLLSVGDRLRELHVRSARKKVWTEVLEDSDIDYRAVAQHLREAKLNPLIVVELAYRKNTVLTRPLVEDLRLSRIYAEKVFGVKASG